MDTNAGKSPKLKAVKGTRNPVWAAYNESVRLVNEAYDAVVKPLRTTLTAKLEKATREYDAKIQPLVTERDTVIGDLKKDFADKVSEAAKKREEGLKRATEVRNAELEAIRQEEKEAAASAA